MSHTTHPTKMNRRELLGAGTVLLGAAATGLSLEPTVAAEKKPAGTASTGPGSTPNYAPPIVQVEGGQLRGFRDGKTTVFLGVPYAVAERFELPQPVPPWQGVKSAQAWGPVCPIPPQTRVGIDEFVFPHRFWIEDEHCQVLNIWTQNPSFSGGKKPVMFWMHGGGFTNGSSMESYAYDGKNLSEFGDVVVVSVNHRLNILGTLDLSAYGPQYAQSRYTGTADLVAALQWVQKNIGQFGGDPGNVTLFGQSGGGSKAARMLHTPVAKGLFHKVVTQSGGGEVYADLDPAAQIKTQQQIAAATLSNLNLTGSDIEQLKKVPYLDLVKAGQAALRSVAQASGVRNLGWNPIVDDVYVTRAFCDWSSSIPQMSGSVFSEFTGNLVKGPGKNEWNPQQVDEHLSAAFGDKKVAVIAAFKNSFPHKKEQDVLYFAAFNTNALAAKAQAGTAPVYHYLFAYEYPVNGGITAFHTSEIAFVFHNLNEPTIRIATGDAPQGYALQDRVATAWLNFARTGNPSQPGLAWKPFTPVDKQTMVFDTLSECRDIHEQELIGLLPPPTPRA